MAHPTPQEGEDLFARLGGMKPSKSSLDRLPKDVSARWERDSLKFEQALRDEEQVPKEAATVAASLDGVLVPMKDDERQEKRALDQALDHDLASHVSRSSMLARESARGRLVGFHPTRVLAPVQRSGSCTRPGQRGVRRNPWINATQTRGGGHS